MFLDNMDGEEMEGAHYSESGDDEGHWDCDDDGAGAAAIIYFQ